MNILKLYLLFSFLGFLNYRCFGIFGAGDIVYDPANVTQTINVLKATESQLDKLGSLLGISTSQLDMLTNLAISIGQSSNTRNINPILSQEQLSNTLSSNNGYSNSNLNALMNSNGVLDAFLGMSLDQWTQIFENPLNYYRNVMINPAINRIGYDSNLSQPTVAYAQWYANQSPEDRANLSIKFENDINELLNSDWLEETKTRKINLQELAIQSKSAQDNSTNATNLSDQQRSQNQLNSINNEILIESATQASAAQDAILRTASLENENLQNIINTKRDSTEVFLNLDH